MICVPQLQWTQRVMQLCESRFRIVSSMSENIEYGISEIVSSSTKLRCI